MKFSYTARTEQGEIKKGDIEASSKRVALNILEKYGFYVTSLKKIGKKKILNIELSFIKGVSQKDVIAFTRQFGVMLKSAIPLVRALRSQAGQTSNQKFSEIILKMTEGIETGSSLSQVMSVHPKIFSTFFVSIIKSGEATGKVADSLGYLSEHLEREYNLKQKIRGAMIYPGFIITVFIGAFFLVTLFTMPKLTEILEEFTSELPLATKVMMSLSEFTKNGGWIVILIVLAGLVLSPQFLKKSKKTKIIYNKIVLRMPVLGNFFKKIALISFAENLSVLIAAGLPITQALTITRDIISSPVYKDIVKKASERVAKGQKISSVFSEYPNYIPSFVIQMVATGEETGRLEELLQDVVSFYRQDVERTSENLTTLLEPFLILVLGIGIAILAISIFVPLFNIGMGGMAS